MLELAAHKRRERRLARDRRTGAGNEQPDRGAIRVVGRIERRHDAYARLCGSGCEQCEHEERETHRGRFSRLRGSARAHLRRAARLSPQRAPLDSASRRAPSERSRRPGRRRSRTCRSSALSSGCAGSGLRRPGRSGTRSSPKAFSRSATTRSFSSASRGRHVAGSGASTTSSRSPSRAGQRWRWTSARCRTAPVRGSKPRRASSSPTAASRRRFAAYWLVVRPFSGFTRRSWLKAAKRRAET